MNYAAHATRSQNQNPADYFYSAAPHRSRGVLWPIFTPARIPVTLRIEGQGRSGSAGVFQPTTQPTKCDVLHDFRVLRQSPRIDTVEVREFESPRAYHFFQSVSSSDLAP